MTDEPMVPLMVPESVVRAAVKKMNMTAEDYRKGAQSGYSFFNRLDCLARAAAIEWVEAHPEREAAR